MAQLLATESRSNPPAVTGIYDAQAQHQSNLDMLNNFNQVSKKVQKLLLGIKVGIVFFINFD